METYLVGGAVRDAVLGLAVTDRDWVVVGATGTEMQAAGYEQVGKDFPVFLHPDTHEEYALARLERKSGKGHHGFAIDAGTHVTLDQDLSRRDLTINALARDATGHIIDPWGGLQDIESRTLRHVSPAFAEDPLRVLRVARFASRFAPLGFRVAPETLALMRDMAGAGELATLPAERICQEMTRALAQSQPRVFFEVLRSCGALKALWPELDQLFGVPQVAEHHPEIDTGEHTLLTLERAVELGAGTAARFATLCHDFGKGTTDPAHWPRHHGHEERGVPLVEASCARLKVPREWRDLAVMSTAYHTHCHRAFELRNTTLVDTLIALDAVRRPERFSEFLLVCTADARGRTGREQVPYPEAARFEKAANLVRAINAAEVVEGIPPDKRRDAIRRARIAALGALAPAP